MKLDLLHDDPQQLARNALLDDLLAAVGAVEVWTNRHGHVLDHIYRNRIARLFRTNALLGEMAALLDHLQRVAHPCRAQALDALDRRYAQRWVAYADLLETQLAVQEAGVPASLLARKHVPEILAGVRDGNLKTKSEVQQRCDLNEIEASRVLALLDAAELVLCQLQKEENRLVAGPRLPEALQLLEADGRLPVAPTTTATAARAANRGCSYFKAA